MPRFEVGDEQETREPKVQVDPPHPRNTVMEFELVVENELDAGSEPAKIQVRTALR